jgi:DNA invertase Pin-like site-specific DNA recombinase
VQKAYSYIRFSNATQALGDSYRRQREQADEYCLANDLQLVDSNEYLFFDQGKSAYKANHLDDTGELSRFLGLVNSGAIPVGSYLLVESLDRLSRERVKDALPRFLDLLNKGINVVTLADKKLYTSDYNELDLIISIVLMSRAHEESATKATRISKAWANKHTLARSEGKPLGKQRPLWLEYSPDGYTLIPDRVQIVQTIFQLAIDGYGHRAIAAQLNQQGLPPFTASQKNASGLWANSSIAHILRSRAVLGEYQPHQLVSVKEEGGKDTRTRQPVGDVIAGYFPAVITEDQWYSAQHAVASRKRNQSTKPSKNFNVWSGIAHCLRCSSNLHISNRVALNKKTNIRTTRKVLRCFNSIKGVCKAKNIPLLPSEMMFREILAKVDSLALIQDSSATIQTQLNVIDAKANDVRSRLTELSDQVATLGTRLPTTIIQLMASLEDTQHQLQAEREQLLVDLGRERIISKTDFFNLLDLVSYEGRARANSLLKTLGVKVMMSRDRVKQDDTGTISDTISAKVLVKNVIVFFVGGATKGEVFTINPVSRSALDASHAQGDLQGDYEKYLACVDASEPGYIALGKRSPVL